MMQVSEDIIMSRVEATQPDYDNYCANIANGYNYIKLIVSILAEPFINFVEIFVDIRSISSTYFLSSKTKYTLYYC